MDELHKAKAAVTRREYGRCVEAFEQWVGDRAMSKAVYCEYFHSHENEAHFQNSGALQVLRWLGPCQLCLNRLVYFVSFAVVLTLETQCIRVQ